MILIVLMWAQTGPTDTYTKNINDGNYIGTGALAICVGKAFVG